MRKKPPPETYQFTCALCEELGESNRPDAEALAEAQVKWPGTPVEDMFILCDECYEKVMEFQRLKTN